MTASYSHLLAPGRIGSMELRNRIVMSPMETMYGTPDGLPSERTIAHFARRAAGGVGLVTVGATGVDADHPETPGGLQIATDAAVAAHRELVEAVHAEGARIQPQIVHAGPDGLGPEMYGVPSLGPSVIPSYLTGTPSTPATAEQIRAILEQFRAAVVRVREAGYDGLELHAAHGYMFLGSFLAPHRNRRSDRWSGSSPEGRIRVVLDALAAIRAEVGADFPITLRISGYERVAGGRPLWETAQVAPLLVEAGVDAFHVSGGVIDRYVTGMVNAAADGDGLNVAAATAVRQAVSVPVIAVGRLHEPRHAEQVLADGRADFVALGRPLLADPDLPRKLASGVSVRPCISCENCIDTLEEKLATECAVNPWTGHDHELPEVASVSRLASSHLNQRRLPAVEVRAPEQRLPAVEVRAPASLETPGAPHRVVVVGGGPAGMEAARLAAARGDHVVLLERAEELGGDLVWASRVHPENRPYLDWLRTEIRAAEIDVRPQTEATPELVASLAPDTVVVASGGRVEFPTLTGDEYARRFSPDLPDGRRIVVVGGRSAAIEYAAWLAEHERLVTVLEPGELLAPEFGWKRRTEHMDALDRLGVAVHVGARIEGIEPGGVRFRPAHTSPRTIAADEVVLAGEVRPDTALAEAITERLPDVDVRTVGDATGLGLIRGATRDAAEAVLG